MRVQLLERHQWVPAPLDEVFAFFARAENLEAITPRWLAFRILTRLPIAMGQGCLIDYQIKLGPAPLKWRTLIEVWDPPHRFVDTQLKGPYALWHHTHTFAASGSGTLIADRVRYRLPFGPLGTLAHLLWVRAQLGAIFDHRFREIQKRFGAPGVEAAA